MDTHGFYSVISFSGNYIYLKSPMSLDDIIERLKVPLIEGSVWLNTILFVLLYTGIFTVNVYFAKQFNIFIQIIISLFLMYRFNPFVKHELKKRDSSIIFTCAILLLTNLGITQYYLHNIETSVKTQTTNGMYILEHGLDDLRL